MSKDLIKRYFEEIDKFDDKEHLFYTIAYHVAPVIYGVKPSCIITLKKNKRELHTLWNIYKEEFKKEFNLEYFEIKEDSQYMIVMIYNNKMLIDILTEENNIEFLRKFGYNKDFTINEFLKLLKLRYDKICPHEMGIFLGFPLQDVRCFIDNPEKECLLCGYWKVYHDLEMAMIKFNSYDKAKYIIVKNILQKC